MVKRRGPGKLVGSFRLMAECKSRDQPLEGLRVE